MKNILITLIISTIILSCKKENNYDNDIELCKILGEMTSNDQKYRAMPQLSDQFFRIMDSLKTANNISREEYANLTKEEQLEWGKIGREITNRIPKANQKEKDSLWKLQNEIDDKNTKLLIEIVNKRGWVDKVSLNCEEYVSTWVIFRHSPEKYWKEIKPIIDKEKAEKRLSGSEYMMIENHIKGRPTFDFNYTKTDNENE